VLVPSDYTYIVSASALLNSPPSDPSQIQLYQSHVFSEGDSTDTNAGSGWELKFGTSAQWIGLYAVLALRQVYTPTGDAREFSRVVVQINA